MELWKVKHKIEKKNRNEEKCKFLKQNIAFEEDESKTNPTIIIHITYHYISPNCENKSMENMYLSLGISLSCSFVIVSELFCCEFYEIPLNLLAILLLMKSPVASAVFWIILFEVVLSASIADYLAWSRSFWLYLPFKF